MRRSNPNYRGYCLHCFIHIYPDESISRYYMIKERYVTDFIKATFPEFKMQFNRSVPGGTSRKRPDIIIYCLTYNIIIEIDENGHKNYSCENKRIMMIFNDLGALPLVVIRINPDEYTKNNESFPSSFKYHKTLGVPMIRDEIEWQSRLNILKTTIEKYINIKPIKEMTFEYLYYDDI